MFNCKKSICGSGRTIVVQACLKTHVIMCLYFCETYRKGLSFKMVSLLFIYSNKLNYKAWVAKICFGQRCRQTNNGVILTCCWCILLRGHWWGYGGRQSTFRLLEQGVFCVLQILWQCSLSLWKLHNLFHTEPLVWTGLPMTCRASWPNS